MERLAKAGSDRFESECLGAISKAGFIARMKHRPRVEGRWSENSFEHLRRRPRLRPDEGGRATSAEMKRRSREEVYCFEGGYRRLAGENTSRRRN